ncbi:MAG: hypothetical protein ACD_71C00190G0004 [uncultured bacterium (gcode 4)]|uniref:Uncharacterized protein n=1 Tax=uncultured bacterium (gcode 4) TaxID=1234023 RepID=K1YMS9_9BACT|nr:MAG: hypothetical protein ACD_71C00190G0004 [uncultured bacterium (gcode 4)]
MSLDQINLTPPPSVEHATKKSIPSLKDITEDANTRLSWIRLELPKTKEERERAVYSAVIKNTFKEEMEKNEYPQWITIKFIKEWVFSMTDNETGNVNYYLREDGTVILGIASIHHRQGMDNGKTLADLWLREIKNGHKYRVYRLNGKELWNEVNQETEEWYEMWNNAMFHTDIYRIVSLLKTPVELDEDWIDGLAEDGSLRFQDLEALKAKWAINETVFQYGVQELRKVLPFQCDPKNLISGRMAKYGDMYTLKTDPKTGEMAETRTMSIHESDLKDYLKKGYITPELAKQCFQMLPEERRDVSEKRK